METRTMPSSGGPKEEDKEKRKYPRFVYSEDDCLYCSGISKLIHVQVEKYEGREVVMMTYECTSKYCDFLLHHKKRYVYRMYDFGKNSVEQFNKYQNKKNPLETITEEDIVGEA